MYAPLQSLADPRFAVPFGIAVLGGLLAVLAGTVLSRAGRSRSDTRAEDATYQTAGAGFVAGGLALVAFGFNYAGTFARLIRGAGGSMTPSTLGRIGLILPWTAVVGVLGVLSVAGFALALGVALFTGIRDQHGGQN